MAEVWGALGALAVIILPLALAAWLLARSDGPRRRSPHRPHGKMPDPPGDRPHAD
jgi:hypothetical protein